MAQIIDENVKVCTDCIMAIANNDYSGLDGTYSEAEAEEKQNEIMNGIAALTESGRYVLATGDEENDDLFSSEKCRCCGTRLAGFRHQCVLMD